MCNSRIVAVFMCPMCHIPANRAIKINNLTFCEPYVRLTQFSRSPDSQSPTRALRGKHSHFTNSPPIQSPCYGDNFRICDVSARVAGVQSDRARSPANLRPFLTQLVESGLLELLRTHNGMKLDSCVEREEPGLGQRGNA